MADGQKIESLGGSSSGRVAALAAAQEHMRHRRWAAAAEALGAVGDDPQARSQGTICRNLAALQVHRPAVYAAVLGGGGQERYTVGPAACGHPTVYERDASGSLASLSPGNHPVAALSATFAKIKENYQAGHPMAILGIGDGYLLKSCALHPPTMLFDAEQAVYLFEPDPQAVLACLTIHDYTGAAGPIEQARFHWFVGADYLAQTRGVLLGDLYNPTPQFEVSQSRSAAQIGAALNGLLGEFLRRHDELRAKVHARYASISRFDWRAIYSDHPPRTPRVLLITTRQSSVLQYSTRDAADGFAAIGWRAEVFIEPLPHQAVTSTKLLQLLDEFRPDLVFQMDHLRGGWRGMIPPSLPFACWAQDHLPNLTNREAGASVTERDFVLVGMPAMYVERYGYPRRQCVDLTKLTRFPDLPEKWSSDGDDIVYVSSASQRPEAVAAELARRFDQQPELRALVEEACRDQIERYGRGESLPTLHDVTRAFERVERRLGMNLDHPGMRQEVLDALFDRMSNLLYRQQGLRWAASVAKKRGLRLSIYGGGWESHAEFAPFARGKVQYGPALEALTRSAKVNLVLEPFLATSHQRLLDGLAAGGFFLVREHPSNMLMPELLDFVMAHAPQAESVEDVRAGLPNELQEAFESLLVRSAAIAGYGDPVSIVRGGARAGVIEGGRPALPMLADVSFASAAELESRLVAALGEPERRCSIASRQRGAVASRLSYAAGMQRVVRHVADCLATEVSS